MTHTPTITNSEHVWYKSQQAMLQPSNWFDVWFYSFITICITTCFIALYTLWCYATNAFVDIQLYYITHILNIVVGTCWITNVIITKQNHS